MSSNSEEISLKEIVLSIRELLSYLLSKWMVIVIVGVIGGGLGLLYTYISKPLYTGDLTFVLSSGAKSGGGLAGLAGQLGVDIGGGDGEDAFSGDNILELLQSRKIVEGAIFRPLPGTGETLINLIIDKTEMQENWEKTGRFKNMLPFPGDMNQLTPQQDSLVSVVHAFVTKRWLKVERTDKKLSFYKVSTTSTNEMISAYLTRYVVDEASQFYIDTKTQSARGNLNMLQHEADSLGARLNSRIYSMAETADRTFNLNPALQTERVSIQQNQVVGQAMGVAYGEVMKNLEIAKITLQKEKPLFQIIDEPRLPLVKDKLGKLKGLIIGGLLAVVIVVVFFTLRMILKKMFTG